MSEKMSPAEKQRNWRKANPGKAAEHTRLYRERHPDYIPKLDRETRIRQHGISPEHYAILLYAQGGLCAVCAEPNYGKNLCIDHDHGCCPKLFSCGRCIRGLLCDLCNKAEGLLRGNAENLARYLSILKIQIGKELR